MNFLCSFRHHQSCRIPSPLCASAPNQNIFIVFFKHVIKTMANYTRDRGTPFYWHNHSVQTPTFIDLDKYLPKPEDSSVSPFNRQYPKPITPMFINQKSSNETRFKGKKNKNFKATTARSTKSSDGDTLKVNVTREQRTVSLSSGEALYIKSGQDTVRRPEKRHHHSPATPGLQDEIETERTKINYATLQLPHPAKPEKRRHHSTATPGLQDEIEAKRTKINYATLQLPHPAKPAKRRHHSTATPGLQDEIEAKRTKINYATPQLPHPARSLQFNLFDTQQPVFTLETLTNEINKECVKCVQTVETLQKKLKLKAFLEGFLSPAFPGCSLHLCGSSNNGFGHDSSDADFCCIVNHLRQGNNRHHALSVLRQMQKLLNNDPKTTFLSRCSVIPATVPILKFIDTISGCDCDININNVVGVRNTHLLRAYCGVDYRVQPLVMLVKKWAKKHDINDASCGTLSSYALTLMVLHYLQGICKPAVVPVLQRQYPTVFKYHGDVSNLLGQDPCKLIACNQSENRQSLGELFVGFFKYYALDFRWNTDYISVASGSAYPRYSGQWKRKPIVIEEPFDGNNVAKAVNHQFDKIHMKFRLAWHTLKISPSLESIKVT